MEQKQKYSTSTVLITIAFLALFIILPPITRILYAEEEVIDQSMIRNNENYQEDEDDEEEVEVIENIYNLVCEKKYTNANLSITTKSLYKGDEWISNSISFDNPNQIDNPASLKDTVSQEEARQYLELFNSFAELDSSNIQIIGTTTIITISNNMENNSLIELHSKERLSQLAYYQENGYSCREE